MNENEIAYDQAMRAKSEGYAQALKAMGKLMKRTVIGQERSVPDGTEIWFVFKEEFEALCQKGTGNE